MPANRNDVPLYAQLSRDGHLITVHCKKTHDSSARYGGSVEQITKMFGGKGIPLVDMRVGNLDRIVMLGVEECTLMHDSSNPANHPGLDEYLTRCREAGCRMTEL